MVTFGQADRSYPAKLLLFGEYVILLSGAAIALPFHSYSGHWEVTDNSESPAWADAWLAYLKKHCATFLDLSEIGRFLNDHIYVSDIPIGSGIGSSGALTASLYDIGKSMAHADLTTLQDRLALMESHFHGKSSGLDPLVSYLNNAVYQSADNTITQVDKINLGKINAYLLDSKSPRQGKSFIKAFMTAVKANPEPYQDLVELSNKVISSMVDGPGVMMKDLMKLSQSQYQLMPDMIIDDIRNLWRSGIDNGQYATKLCGAGGGGYYLVFAEEEISQIGPYQLIKIQMP